MIRFSGPVNYKDVSFKCSGEIKESFVIEHCCFSQIRPALRHIW